MTQVGGSTIRWLPVAARAGYGTVLVAAPRLLLRTGAATHPDWAPAVARLLGARHLVQAAALAARPRLAGLGTAVDLAHAATDLICAAVRPDLRTPPLLDAAVASALAAAALVSASEGSSE